MKPLISITFFFVQLFYCRLSLLMITSYHTYGRARSVHTPQSLVDQRSQKPETVLFYNSTKGGVDVINATIEGAGASSGVGRRWPIRVLMYLVAASTLNGHHVYISRFPTTATPTSSTAAEGRSVGPSPSS